MKRARENSAQKLFRAVTGRSPDVQGRSAAAKVRELRRARRGKTQKEVAKELGVTPRTVQRWQAGTQEPSKRHAQKLNERMRAAMTEARGDKVKRARRITVKARVKIGNEPERSRTFNVTDDALKAQLAAAAASDDPGAVNAVLASVVAQYIGASKDYPVQVSEIHSVGVSL